MAVYTVLDTGVDTVRVHNCVHGLYAAVYRVVYTFTVCVQGRFVYAAVYTARTRRVHGGVQGRV